MRNTNRTTDRACIRARLWRGFVAALAATVGVVGLGLAAGSAQAQTDVVVDGGAGAPQVSLIGDSTLAGVRWYADYGPLRKFSFVLSAESCRRTYEQSCISREGYRSENVISAMRSLDGQLGEVVVIMSGYNDPLNTIDEAIAGVTEEARRQGVEHVVWLTLRTGADVDYSDPQEQSSLATFHAYNEQLIEAAEGSDGFFQVADWATYSLGATDWFETDGVHLTSRGVDALTTYLAGTLDQVLAGNDVTASQAPWTVLVPGAEGERVSQVQAAVIAAGVDVPGGADGVYGYDTMAAVAEYQRQAADLLVTGAVDIDTARALGVFDDGDAADDDAADTGTQIAESAAVPSPAVQAAAPSAVTGTGSDAAGGISPPRWVSVAALTIAGLVILVVARRRHVVRRRQRARSPQATWT